MKSHATCDENGFCEPNGFRKARVRVSGTTAEELLELSVEDDQMKIPVPNVEWPYNYTLPEDGTIVYYKIRNIDCRRLQSLVKVSDRERVKRPMQRRAVVGSSSLRSVRVLLEENRSEKLGITTDDHKTSDGFFIPSYQLYALEDIKLQATLEYFKSGMTTQGRKLYAMLAPPMPEDLVFTTGAVASSESSDTDDLELAPPEPSNPRGRAFGAFKPLLALQQELRQVANSAWDSSETLSLGGLQPWSTSAFEEFCQSSLLDCFTRMIFKIKEPLALVKNANTSSDQGTDTARKRLRQWVLDLLSSEKDFSNRDYADKVIQGGMAEQRTCPTCERDQKRFCCLLCDNEYWVVQPSASDCHECACKPKARACQMYFDVHPQDEDDLLRWTLAQLLRAILSAASVCGSSRALRIAFWCVGP